VVAFHTLCGVQNGWPHWAVGTKSASLSAIGLPSMVTSASRMLSFVTPPEVSSNFMNADSFDSAASFVLRT
jgi:hypothetical protein